MYALCYYNLVYGNKLRSNLPPSIRYTRILRDKPARSLYGSCHYRDPWLKTSFHCVKILSWKSNKNIIFCLHNGRGHNLINLHFVIIMQCRMKVELFLYDLIREIRKIQKDKFVSFGVTYCHI